MQLDTYDRIDTLTQIEYLRALTAVNPSEQQREMLQIHLSAPGKSLTARQLAKAIGFSNWNAANLQYGTFAGKLRKELQVEPEQNLHVIATFLKQPNEEWQWQLRPNFVAALIEFGIDAYPSTNALEELDANEDLVEGTAFTVKVNAYERNPVARQKCINYYGFSCYVCKFNFKNTYSEITSDHIHVHHLIPLASVGKEYVIDPIQDLRPVCANCHTVIHLRTPPYSIEEMKLMLSGSSGCPQTT